MYTDAKYMITAPQLRAARALLGIDQPTLAQRARLSLPTIQRMETSGGLIRGNVDSLTKVVQALEDMGVELLGEGSVSTVGGRGVRLREREVRMGQMSAQQLPKTERMTVGLSTAAADGRGQSD
jgi:transcriptional regulator with XRE-family HTH domain